MELDPPFLPSFLPPFNLVAVEYEEIVSREDDTSWENLQDSPYLQVPVFKKKLHVRRAELGPEVDSEERALDLGGAFQLEALEDGWFEVECWFEIGSWEKRQRSPL